MSSKAILVSRNLPPVRAKLAGKVWRKEFVDLDLLLPARLGTPEPTLGDLVTGEKRQKEKKSIRTIQDALIHIMAVVVMREPGRAKDPLIET